MKPFSAWYLSAFLALACGGIVEGGPSNGSEAGAGGSLSGTGGSASIPLPHGNSGGGCPKLAGPLMVQVDSTFCIDSTEVTRADYQTWLDAQPLTADQPSYCAWNTSFAPSCASGSPVPDGSADSPVVCVDWCDAYAYCRGAGKRLCGNRGGGPVAYDSYDDPEESEWDYACTSGGKNQYAYGPGFDASACQIDHNPVAVGSHPSCQSDVTDFRGIFDLSGNVAEWEDSCNGNTGHFDQCRTRGGGTYGVIPDETTACNAGGAGGYRGEGMEVVGFRCCWP
jgi:sulfatase modifying factor 1